MCLIKFVKNKFMCEIFSIVNVDLEIILIRKLGSSKMDLFSLNSSRANNI